MAASASGRRPSMPIVCSWSARGPEAAWNGVVLLRELRTQGFTHRKGCVEVASSQPPSAPYESRQGRRQSTHHHP